MMKTEIEKNMVSGAAVLIVSDIQNSVMFYRDHLGFQIDQIWGEPPGFAIAETPSTSVMLKQEVNPDDAKTSLPNAQRIGGLWDIYFWVRDLPALTSDFDQRNTHYSAPEETAYGCTEIVVTDPDGHRICFGYCP